MAIIYVISELGALRTEILLGLHESLNGKRISMRWYQRAEFTQNIVLPLRHL